MVEPQPQRTLDPQKQRGIGAAQVSSALRGIALCAWMGWVAALPLQAQDHAAVQYIRAIYKAVNDGIAACEPDAAESCGYYQNTLVVNRQSQPWAVVGIYTAVQDFWYCAVDGTEGPRYTLRKVNAKTQRSARTEHEEWLYDSDGKLLFYFFKLAGDGQEGQELRFYFDNERLVGYVEDVSASERAYQQWEKSDAPAILKAAQELNEWFQKTL